MVSRRRFVGAVPVVALMLLAGVLGSGGSSASAADAATYYRIKPLCPAPAPGHAACFLWERVPVRAGAPGALPVKPSGVAMGPAGGYTPADLAGAYNIDSNAPTTKAVAVVSDGDDTMALNDLDTFDAQYGLPPETASSFEKVSQTGSTTQFPPQSPEWAVEESLDIEAVRGMCHACKIFLVESDGQFAPHYEANFVVAEKEAFRLGAGVISNSWGFVDRGMSSSDDKAFQRPGRVIVAASGDDGINGWDWCNPWGDGCPYDESSWWPDSLDTVISVGATTLTLNSDGSRAAETVWNANGPSDVNGQTNFNANRGATGGGCTGEFANRPATPWQEAVPSYVHAHCDGQKLENDIAADGDPATGFDIYSSVRGGWITVGGTSLSAPLIAGMWALAGGSGGVANPSLSLYGNWKTTRHTSLYDVVSGGNGYCDGVTPKACAAVRGNPNTEYHRIQDCAWDENGNRVDGLLQCDAGAGFDGPSGVGTPNGLRAFQPIRPRVVPNFPPEAFVLQPATFSASATDPFPGGTIASYTWSWGDGTPDDTGSSVDHTYTNAGQYTVKLTVADTYGMTRTLTDTLNVD
jgi:hypothetical protein